MTINENAAYLKGLYEGYGLSADDKAANMIGKMLDLISEMAEKISDLENANAELQEYIEEIDEDLGAIEDDFYLDEDEEDEYDEDGDDDYYEIVCPNCGETVCFDSSLDPDSLVCPACGEKIDDVELCDGECENCDKKICEED